MGCVMHIDCSLIAEIGAIYFGEYNIIEERVRIVNNSIQGTMQIGSYNLFEVGCIVENSNIGNMNTISHRVKIPTGCTIGSKCVIVAGVELEPGTVVPDGTVVYGNGVMRPL
mmetsp:Transcript_17698/g.2903  ORF Transcript_17698/g.2903 Transcript_17698/m.2903 type:complete len:112 (+) Transcript_17698:73-408(+)